MEHISAKCHKGVINELSAKARKDDPVQSHMAADRVNKGGKLPCQRLLVLRYLRRLQPCTAKNIDYLMNLRTHHDKRNNLAHRRMRELETMGLVKRQGKENDKKLREMICSLTAAGEKFLRDK